MGPDPLEAIFNAIDFVALRQGQPIHEPMEPITELYFLTTGISSEIAIDDSGRWIEVGCVGNEGLAGVSRYWALIDPHTARSWRRMDRPSS